MKEFFSNPAVWGIALFFVLNLINVILGTMRSILTVKSTPFVSMVINTVSYTFYAGIVKLVSGQSMAIVLITTAVTNIIGVYLAQYILKKTRKDKLWIIEINTTRENAYYLADRLDMANIGYIVTLVNDRDTKINYNLRIYSYTQENSSAVKKMIASLSDVFYNITESGVKL